jgi:hypothetical protein
MSTGKNFGSMFTWMPSLKITPTKMLSWDGVEWARRYIEK